MTGSQAKPGASGWTKGPWSLDETLKPMGGCLSRAVFASDTFVAEVLHDDEDDPVATANAHLIASAPELFEALEAYLFAEEIDDPAVRQSELAVARQDAHAALAKARGEAL
jgi:hypothetical protein